MHDTPRAVLVAASILCFGATLVACSDDEGSLSSRVTAAGVDASTADGRWASLLQMVPDTADTRGMVTMVDIAGAVEAAGIARPDETASSDDVATYLVEVFSVSPDRGAFAYGPSWIVQAAQADEEYRAEMGFSMTQIDAAVEAGLPPEIYEGFLGSFDPAAIDATLAEVPVWSDVQETVTYEGVDYYRWGEDGEINASQTSPARPLGIGGRMVVDDTSVMITRSDAAMEAMIDARAGDGNLADNEDFALIADALEEEPVYSALLTDDVIDAPTDADGPPALVGVEAYGTAWGLDDAGTITSLLVLVSADETAAQANIDLMTERLAEGVSEVTGEPYAEFTTVASAETDGRVTIVQIDTERPRFFVDALFRRDPVVANG